MGRGGGNLPHEQLLDWWRVITNHQRKWAKIRVLNTAWLDSVGSRLRFVRYQPSCFDIKLKKALSLCLAAWSEQILLISNLPRLLSTWCFLSPPFPASRSTALPQMLVSDILHSAFCQQPPHWTGTHTEKRKICEEEEGGGKKEGSALHLHVSKATKEWHKVKIPVCVCQHRDQVFKGKLSVVKVKGLWEAPFCKRNTEKNLFENLAFFSAHRCLLLCSCALSVSLSCLRQSPSPLF